MSDLYVVDGYVDADYAQSGVTIYWSRREIFVPRTYAPLISTVPSEVRQLDVDAFRRDLKLLEATETGMPFPDTHRHNTTVIVGGLTLARVVEFINDYTITFEDGEYTVALLGANTNLNDVVNRNSVGVTPNNSAGLVEIERVVLVPETQLVEVAAQGLTPQQELLLLEVYRLLGLDPTRPLVVTSDQREAGPELVQSISEDQDGTVTVTRE